MAWFWRGGGGIKRVACSCISGSWDTSLPPPPFDIYVTSVFSRDHGCCCWMMTHVFWCRSWFGECWWGVRLCLGYLVTIIILWINSCHKYAQRKNVGFLFPCFYFTSLHSHTPIERTPGSWIVKIILLCPTIWIFPIVTLLSSSSIPNLSVIPETIISPCDHKLSPKTPLPPFPQSKYSFALSLNITSAIANSLWVPNPVEASACNASAYTKC